MHYLDILDIRRGCFVNFAVNTEYYRENKEIIDALPKHQYFRFMMCDAQSIFFGLNNYKDLVYFYFKYEIDSSLILEGKLSDYGDRVSSVELSDVLRLKDKKVGVFKDSPNNTFVRMK